MLDLYRPSIRAAAAIVVLAAWVASLGWLGFRRLSETEASTLSSQATLRLSPGTVWYALDVGDVQVGNASVTLDTLSPGYSVTDQVMMAAPLGDSVVRMTWRTDAWLGSTLNVEHVHTRFSRDNRQADWDVLVADDTASGREITANRRASGRLRFAEPPTTAWILPYRLALGGSLIPGRVRTIAVLDGLPGAAGTAHVTVGTDTVIQFADSSRFSTDVARWTAAHSDTARTFPVLLALPGGPRRIWVDRHGAVSRLTTPFGATWRRTDFDLSETAFRKEMHRRADTIRRALPRLLPFSSLFNADSSTAEQRFVVVHRDGSPIDRELLALLGGGRQHVEGDTITVEPGPMSLPGEFAHDTIGDLAVQSGAGAIDREAQRLIDRPISREGMPAFVAAFHHAMHVDSAAGAPDDALSTLHAHGGRADGIARLFVSLLRAANVPARYVVGVFPAGDTLYTHAWAEVWSSEGSGWYAVDPVSGHALATTALIRTGFAGSSHPDDMLAELANARFIPIPAKGSP